MATPVLTAAAVISCAHGGVVATPPITHRVLANGAPVLTVNSLGLVHHCPVPPPGACLTVQWSAGASRVLVAGRPILLQTSAGLCMSATGVASGPTIVATAQLRVLAV